MTLFGIQSTLNVALPDCGVELPHVSGQRSLQELPFGLLIALHGRESVVSHHRRHIIMDRETYASSTTHAADGGADQ
jgi:hypothetical protein